jgi:undecaprenyl-diphosphatase
MFETPALRHIVRTWARFRAWAGLPTSWLIAVAAAIVALVSTLVILSGVTEDVTRHNGLSSTDPKRLQWFIDHRPHALVTAARYLTEAASPIALALVVSIAAVVLWLSGQRLLLAIAPGLAFGFAGLLAGLGKVVVGRGRPPVPLHLIAETDPSFPSGHATEGTAVFVTLALIVSVFVLRKAIARTVSVAAAVMLSTAVGASRLVLGVHWPSDVIAGLLLGFAVALTVTLVASLTARLAPNRPVTSRPLGALLRIAISERHGRPLHAVALRP